MKTEAASDLGIKPEDIRLDADGKTLDIVDPAHPDVIIAPRDSGKFNT